MPEDLKPKSKEQVKSWIKSKEGMNKKIDEEKL